mgnify:CR=1 FL=1
MNIDEFVENFALQFDDTDPDDITKDTIYEELEEWSSLIALSVIAMVDQDYGVGIGAKEIIESETVEGLFLIIKKLKK